MKIKDYLKEKDIAILFAMIGFSLIICFNFLKPHYPQDAYYISAYGYEPYINTYLVSNRIFCALLFKIYIKFNISLDMQMHIMATIQTLTMSIGWFILYKISSKLLNEKKSMIINLIIVFASFLIIFNICTTEGLLFVEDSTMPIGVLFAILGASVFIREKKSKYIVSLILVTISGLLYQGTASVFVILALLFSFIKNKDNKKIIIREILVIGLIYGIAMLFNFMGIKIWSGILNHETRKFVIPSIQTIWDTVLKYGKIILINNCNISKKYWYLSMITVISIFFVFNLKNQKKVYWTILEYLFIIILSIIVPIAPIALMPVELQYIEPRMAMSFGIIIGVLLIYVSSKIDLERKKYIKKVILLISTINFIINSIFVIEAATSTIRVNKIEEIITMQIVKEIEDYENRTNIKITGIGIAFDKNYTMYYEGEPELRCFNVRSLGTTWAVKEMITTYSGEVYNNVETPEYIKEMFLNKDWNYFNSEQLYFEGENLYICIF